MNTKYKDAFAEVYVILKYLDEEDYEKIPEDLLNVIDKNRNKEYEYEINDDFDLEKQPMLIETKAILFNIFRDYLSTPEQKEKIIKMQREDIERIRKKKSVEFENAINKKVVLENKNQETRENENVSLIKIEKESLWRKLLNKILKKHN